MIWIIVVPAPKDLWMPSSAPAMTPWS